MRPAPNKQDALVLDFAGNVLRHGPVDAVRPRDKTPGAGGGEAPPGKECPQCHTIVSGATRVCPVCGHVWPVIHAQTASEAPILSSQVRPEWLLVKGVTYRRHRKIGKPDSLRVDYMCGLRIVSEYICLEHLGYPQQKAREWMARRDPTGKIKTISDALHYSHRLEQPVEILVRVEGKYDRILNYRFAGGADQAHHPRVAGAGA